MTTSARLSREQILALPPVITLAELAAALDVSQPTVRAAHRRGELASMGIKVNKLGNRWLVVTASVWAFLGLDRASTAPSAPSATGQHGPAAYVMRLGGISSGSGRAEGPGLD